MSTRSFVSKSELFDWLRSSVRRRENVALRIVTDPQRHTITLRLSMGRLVYVKCEDHGPLDALVLLTECEQVSFSYSSVRAIGGVGFGAGNASIAEQLLAQAIGVCATIAYTFVVSFALLQFIDVAMGLRVTGEQEEEGLDLALHDERGYIL